MYLTEWKTTHLSRIISENPDKSKLDCLQILFDKLQALQYGLAEDYTKEYDMRDQLINACRGVQSVN